MPSASATTLTINSVLSLVGVVNKKNNETVPETTATSIAASETRRNKAMLLING